MVGKLTGEIHILYKSMSRHLIVLSIQTIYKNWSWSTFCRSSRGSEPGPGEPPHPNSDARPNFAKLSKLLPITDCNLFTPFPLQPP